LGSAGPGRRGVHLGPRGGARLLPGPLGRLALRLPGGFGAFTPDNYPIVDWVLPNVYGILDSNHGFKMLALGEQVASDIARSKAPALAPFRMKRFEQAALRPVSNSPYPWN